MLCGVTHSGKTTLRRSASQLQQLLVVSADDLRAAVDRYVDFGEDSLVIDHPERRRKGEFVAAAREAVFDRAFAQGVAIVSDANNKQRAVRATRLQQAADAGYRSAIVWVRAPETVILARLEEDDRRRRAAGLSPFWVREYLEVHRPTFEPPTPGEADEFLEVNTDDLESPRLRISLLGGEGE